VHSLKDLPVEEAPGLTVGCVPKRAEVRDALISAKGYRLATLPQGARVGTSSLRRAAQLLSLRPDLKVLPLRGNVDTRLHKALEGQYEAIVVAGAGLQRLGLDQQVSEWLPLEVMLPAPGQGALAVQCRRLDEATLGRLAVLEDAPARRAVTAERRFLLGLGGGCAVPVAAYAESSGFQEEIRLTGLVASLDGAQVVRVAGVGTDPVELGGRLAAQAIAEGAASILEI
jgi:hydroxymethylbilane synthase